MTASNLSKITPKLRTTGNITGNFGRPKSKAGSSLNDITAGPTGKLPSKREWFDTLLSVWPSQGPVWRRRMLPQLRQLAATLNALPELSRVTSASC